MDLSYSNDDNTVVCIPERALDIFIRMPVVIPAGIVQQVPKVEFPARIKLDTRFEAALAGFFHGCCAAAPIVEVSSHKGSLYTFGLLRLYYKCDIAR